MKYVLYLLGILAILYVAAASIPTTRREFKEFVAAAIAKCNKEAGIDGDERKESPLTDGGTCCPWCACWVNEIGYMTDGRWNKTNAEKINKLKWEEPQKAKKNDDIDEICFKEVSPEGKKECESALQYRDCKRRLAQQIIHGDPVKL